MLTLRMCLSTEMNAKISAAIYTIRAFPTAPLCYMKLNRQVFNKEVATKKNISRVDRAPRKSALLNAKSSRHPSGGRSNQPRSQLSLLQRRVKKTSRTITVDERGRASERGRRPSSIRTRAPSPFSPNGGSEPCKSRKWPRGNEGERKTGRCQSRRRIGEGWPGPANEKGGRGRRQAEGQSLRVKGGGIRRF